MKKLLFLIFSCCLIIPSGSLMAEVADTSAYGFTVKQVVLIPSMSADSVYHHLLKDVGKWWDTEHTWSGDAGNLSITVSQNGGCFCERLKNGGVVRHMSVIYADPGKKLRMSGGLGPLQEMAVTGVMTISLYKKEQGVEVEMVYTVGGYSKFPLAKIAVIVDMVLGQQLKRFQAFCK
jgi:hypothetical protein